MAPPTPAASLKVRPNRYRPGSQTNSDIKLSASKVYSSFDEAVRNGSTRYKEDGVIYVISKKKIKDGLWSLNSQTEAAHGRKIREGTNSGRRQRSSATYNQPPAGQRKPVVSSRADQKISRINHRSQQFHHIMDLDGYKHIYAGLDPKGIQELNRRLNAKGFFPGDDPRNYIGLVGSNHGSGSEHQGQVHPLTNRYRQSNPIPDINRLRGLNSAQRAELLIPHLQAERGILQQVVRDNRRTGLASQPAPARSAKAAAGVAAPPIKPWWASLMQIGSAPSTTNSRRMFNASQAAAQQLTRIVNSTNDVLRIIPGQGLPGAGI